MRLVDKDLFGYLNNNEIMITPAPNPDSVRGTNIDLTLGNQFSYFNNHNNDVLDLSEKLDLTPHIEEVVADEFVLYPNDFALAITKEVVKLPYNIIGWLDGRSSLARVGLMVHVTAHRIDCGFNGNIVLELKNLSNKALKIHAGMKICSISFEKLVKTPNITYDNDSLAKYRQQNELIQSRFNLD